MGISTTIFIPMLWTFGCINLVQINLPNKTRCVSGTSQNVLSVSISSNSFFATVVLLRVDTPVLQRQSFIQPLSLNWATISWKTQFTAVKVLNVEPYQQNGMSATTANTLTLEEVKLIYSQGADIVICTVVVLWAISNIVWNNFWQQCFQCTIPGGQQGKYHFHGLYRPC